MISKTAIVYPFAKIVGASEIEVGHQSQIDDFVFINTGVACQLGMFVHVASFCSIIGGGRFVMGDFSGLSAGCRIITGSDDFSGGFLTNPTVPSQFSNVHVSEVIIGKHAIIGTNSVIFPGVKIGEGVAVGAGCIVRKDLEPWSIYAGFSPRVVGKRDKRGVLEQELALRESDAWRGAEQ